MKARICFLHKTAAEWENFSTQYLTTQGEPFILAPGELIIYDPDENTSYARMKVGDGRRQLHELDFFISSAAAEMLEDINFAKYIDGGRI